VSRVILLTLLLASTSARLSNQICRGEHGSACEVCPYWTTRVLDASALGQGHHAAEGGVALVPMHARSAELFAPACGGRSRSRSVLSTLQSVSSKHDHCLLAATVALSTTSNATAALCWPDLKQAMRSAGVLARAQTRALGLPAPLVELRVAVLRAADGSVLWAPTHDEVHASGAGEATDLSGWHTTLEGGPDAEVSHPAEHPALVAVGVLESLKELLLHIHDPRETDRGDLCGAHRSRRMQLEWAHVVGDPAEDRGHRARYSPHGHRAAAVADVTAALHGGSPSASPPRMSLAHWASERAHAEISLDPAPKRSRRQDVRRAHHQRGCGVRALLLERELQITASVAVEGASASAGEPGAGAGADVAGRDQSGALLSVAASLRMVREDRTLSTTRTALPPSALEELERRAVLMEAARSEAAQGATAAEAAVRGGRASFARRTSSVATAWPLRGEIEEAEEAEVTALLETGRVAAAHGRRQQHRDVDAADSSGSLGDADEERVGIPTQVADDLATRLSDEQRQVLDLPRAVESQLSSREVRFYRKYLEDVRRLVARVKSSPKRLADAGLAFPAAFDALRTACSAGSDAEPGAVTEACADAATRACAVVDDVVSLVEDAEVWSSPSATACGPFAMPDRGAQSMLASLATVMQPSAQPKLPQGRWKPCTWVAESASAVAQHGKTRLVHMASALGLPGADDADLTLAGFDRTVCEEDAMAVAQLAAPSASAAESVPSVGAVDGIGDGGDEAVELENLLHAADAYMLVADVRAGGFVSGGGVRELMDATRELENAGGEAAAFLPVVSRASTLVSKAAAEAARAVANQGGVKAFANVMVREVIPVAAHLDGGLRTLGRYLATLKVFGAEISVDVDAVSEASSMFPVLELEEQGRARQFVDSDTDAVSSTTGTDAAVGDGAAMAARQRAFLSLPETVQREILVEVNRVASPVAGVASALLKVQTALQPCAELLCRRSAQLNEALCDTGVGERHDGARILANPRMYVKEMRRLAADPGVLRDLSDALQEASKVVAGELTHNEGRGSAKWLASQVVEVSMQSIPRAVTTLARQQRAKVLEYTWDKTFGSERVAAANLRAGAHVYAMPPASASGGDDDVVSDLDILLSFSASLRMFAREFEIMGAKFAPQVGAWGIRNARPRAHVLGFDVLRSSPSSLLARLEEAAQALLRAALRGVNMPQLVDVVASKVTDAVFGSASALSPSTASPLLLRWLVSEDDVAALVDLSGRVQALQVSSRQSGSHASGGFLQGTGSSAAQPVPSSASASAADVSLAKSLSAFDLVRQAMVAMLPLVEAVSKASSAHRHACDLAEDAVLDAHNSADRLLHDIASLASSSLGHGRELGGDMFTAAYEAENDVLTTTERRTHRLAAVVEAGRKFHDVAYGLDLPDMGSRAAALRTCVRAVLGVDAEGSGAEHGASDQERERVISAALGAWSALTVAIESAAQGLNELASTKSKLMSAAAAGQGRVPLWLHTLRQSFTAIGEQLLRPEAAQIKQLAHMLPHEGSESERELEFPVSGFDVDQWEEFAVALDASAFTMATLDSCAVNRVRALVRVVADQLMESAGIAPTTSLKPQLESLITCDVGAVVSSSGGGERVAEATNRLLNEQEPFKSIMEGSSKVYSSVLELWDGLVDLRGKVDQLLGGGDAVARGQQHKSKLTLLDESLGSVDALLARVASVVAQVSNAGIGSPLVKGLESARKFVAAVRSPLARLVTSKSAGAGSAASASASGDGSASASGGPLSTLPAPSAPEVAVGALDSIVGRFSRSFNDQSLRGLLVQYLAGYFSSPTLLSPVGMVTAMRGPLGSQVTLATLLSQVGAQLKQQCGDGDVRGGDGPCAALVQLLVQMGDMASAFAEEGAGSVAPHLFRSRGRVQAAARKLQAKLRLPVPVAATAEAASTASVSPPAAPLVAQLGPATVRLAMALAQVCDAVLRPPSVAEWLDKPEAGLRLVRTMVASVKFWGRTAARLTAGAIGAQRDLHVSLGALNDEVTGPNALLVTQCVLQLASDVMHVGRRVAEMLSTADTRGSGVELDELESKLGWVSHHPCISPARTRLRRDCGGSESCAAVLDVMAGAAPRVVTAALDLARARAELASSFFAQRIDSGAESESSSIDGSKRDSLRAALSFYVQDWKRLHHQLQASLSSSRDAVVALPPVPRAADLVPSTSVRMAASLEETLTLLEQTDDLLRSLAGPAAAVIAPHHAMLARVEHRLLYMLRAVTVHITGPDALDGITSNAVAMAWHGAEAQLYVPTELRTPGSGPLARLLQGTMATAEDGGADVHAGANGNAKGVVPSILLAAALRACAVYLRTVYDVGVAEKVLGARATTATVQASHGDQASLEPGSGQLAPELSAMLASLDASDTAVAVEGWTAASEMATTVATRLESLAACLEDERASQVDKAGADAASIMSGLGSLFLHVYGSGSKSLELLGTWQLAKPLLSAPDAPAFGDILSAWTDALKSDAEAGVDLPAPGSRIEERRFNLIRAVALMAYGAANAHAALFPSPRDGELAYALAWTTAVRERRMVMAAHSVGGGFVSLRSIEQAFGTRGPVATGCATLKKELDTLHPEPGPAHEGGSGGEQEQAQAQQADARHLSELQRYAALPPLAAVFHAVLAKQKSPAAVLLPTEASTAKSEANPTVDAVLKAVGVGKDGTPPVDGEASSSALAKLLRHAVGAYHEAAQVVRCSILPVSEAAAEAQAMVPPGGHASVARSVSGGSGAHCPSDGAAGGPHEMIDALKGLGGRVSAAWKAASTFIASARKLGDAGGIERVGSAWTAARAEIEEQLGCNAGPTGGVSDVVKASQAAMLPGVARTMESAITNLCGCVANAGREMEAVVAAASSSLRTWSMDGPGASLLRSSIHDALLRTEVELVDRASEHLKRTVVAAVLSQASPFRKALDDILFDSKAQQPVQGGAEPVVLQHVQGQEAQCMDVARRMQIAPSARRALDDLLPAAVDAGGRLREALEQLRTAVRVLDAGADAGNGVSGGGRDTGNVAVGGDAELGAGAEQSSDLGGRLQGIARSAHHLRLALLESGAIAEAVAALTQLMGEDQDGGDASSARPAPLLECAFGDLAHDPAARAAAAGWVENVVDLASLTPSARAKQLLPRVLCFADDLSGADSGRANSRFVDDVLGYCMSRIDSGGAKDSVKLALPFSRLLGAAELSRLAKPFLVTGDVAADSADMYAKELSGLCTMQDGELGLGDAAGGASRQVMDALARLLALRGLPVAKLDGVVCDRFPQTGDAYSAVAPRASALREFSSDGSSLVAGAVASAVARWELMLEDWEQYAANARAVGDALAVAASLPSPMRNRDFGVDASRLATALVDAAGVALRALGDADVSRKEEFSSLTCKGGGVPSPASMSSILLYDKEPADLVQYPLGPFPVFGVPVTVVLSLQYGATMKLETGQCRYKYIDGREELYSAVGLSIGGSLYARGDVMVGLSWLGAGLGVTLEVFGLELVPQLDVLPEGAAAAVRVTPYVSTLGGDIHLVIKFLLKTWNPTLFKWKGLRWRLAGYCRALDAESFTSCPLVAGAGVEDTELDELAREFRETPVRPSRLPLSATVEQLALSAPPRAASEGTADPTGSGSMSAPGAATPICTACHRFTSGVGSKSYWVCPVTMQRVAYLAGLPPVSSALERALDEAKVFVRSVGSDPRERSKAHAMALCDETVTDKDGVLVYQSMVGIQWVEEKMGIEWHAFTLSGGVTALEVVDADKATMDAFREAIKHEDGLRLVGTIYSSHVDSVGGKSTSLKDLRASVDRSSLLLDGAWALTPTVQLIPDPVVGWTVGSLSDAIGVEHVGHPWPSTVSAFAFTADKQPDGPAAFSTAQCYRCNMVHDKFLGCPLIGRRGFGYGTHVGPSWQGGDNARGLMLGQSPVGDEFNRGMVAHLCLTDDKAWLQSEDESDEAKAVLDAVREAIKPGSGKYGTNVVVHVCDDGFEGVRGHGRTYEYVGWLAIQTTRTYFVQFRIPNYGGRGEPFQCKLSALQSDWAMSTLGDMRSRAIRELLEATVAEERKFEMLREPCLPEARLPMGATLPDAPSDFVGAASMREVLPGELGGAAGMLELSKSDLCIECKAPSQVLPLPPLLHTLPTTLASSSLRCGPSDGSDWESETAMRIAAVFGDMAPHPEAVAGVREAAVALNLVATAALSELMQGRAGSDVSVSVCGEGAWLLRERPGEASVGSSRDTEAHAGAALGDQQQLGASARQMDSNGQGPSSTVMVQLGEAAGPAAQSVDRCRLSGWYPGLQPTSADSETLAVNSATALDMCNACIVECHQSTGWGHERCRTVLKPAARFPECISWYHYHEGGLHLSGDLNGVSSNFAVSMESVKATCKRHGCESNHHVLVGPSFDVRFSDVEEASWGDSRAATGTCRMVGDKGADPSLPLCNVCSFACHRTKSFSNERCGTQIEVEAAGFFEECARKGTLQLQADLWDSEWKSAFPEVVSALQAQCKAANSECDSNHVEFAGRRFDPTKRPVTGTITGRQGEIRGGVGTLERRDSKDADADSLVVNEEEATDRRCRFACFSGTFKQCGLVVEVDPLALGKESCNQLKPWDSFSKGVVQGACAEAAAERGVDCQDAVGFYAGGMDTKLSGVMGGYLCTRDEQGERQCVKYLAPASVSGAEVLTNRDKIVLEPLERGTRVLPSGGELGSGEDDQEADLVDMVLYAFDKLITEEEYSKAGSPFKLEEKCPRSV